MKNTIIAVIMAAALVISCDDKGIKEAEELLSEAAAAFEEGRYVEALETIDTLRARFPKAIEVRRKALTLYQDVALKQAQEQLAVVDCMLEAVNREYQEKKAIVERHREQLKATEAELLDVNTTKQRLDSLQVRFDTLCETIKYIHKKQEEADGTKDEE